MKNKNFLANRFNHMNPFDNFFNRNRLTDRNFFDDFFRRDPFFSFDSMSNCNVQQIDKDTTRISINVAGIPKDKIDISVKDNVLIIKGEIEEDENADYLYKSFSSKFYNSFQLPDKAEVLEAKLENGILIVDIKNYKAVEAPEKKIAIK